MQRDRYSRMVGWLKVVLPLTALGILSTLFLLSRTIDPQSVIPFAEKEIQDRLRDQQVTGPVYQGITADGDALSFRAETITTPPGGTGGNTAEQVEVVMDLASGGSIILTADEGHFDIAANQSELAGEVTINTSTGYQINSDRLVTQMSRLAVTSPGPVDATGPLGTLEAGAMELNAATEDQPSQLFFTNGVKLVYLPEDIEE